MPIGSDVQRGSSIAVWCWLRNLTGVRGV